MDKLEERIVTVDENGNVIGEDGKGRCHDGGGILHHGFLAMVLNNAGELLLTKRSNKKRLWPGFWDGSVASHVFMGEDYKQASMRRLREEIGVVTAQVRYAFKFRYKASYNCIGTEHEICAVTFVRGIEADTLSYDRNEIAEIKLMSLNALMTEIKKNRHIYTPWLILAMEHLGAGN